MSLLCAIVTRCTSSLTRMIAEVHNTYGQRHRYLLRTDDAGRAETEKQFYVSPFNQVQGRYEMRLPIPGDDLRIDLTYHAAGMKPFVATVRGTIWYVEDRCDGTLTRVRRGSVFVRDLRRHRMVVVHAGHQYLARHRR